MSKADQLQKVKKFLVLSFGFTLCALRFTPLYALDLDKLKIYFLQGDYKAAILEGEKALAREKHDAAGPDELYYLLGLSYLKEGNYLRASDIFEIILKEFKTSNYKQEALLGLGDSYLMRLNLEKSNELYQQLLRDYPNTKLKAQVYQRLSQVAFKKGDTQEAKSYLEKLKTEFPGNPEQLELPSDIYYTIQVGAFSSAVNAGNLTQKLTQEGYPAYIEEFESAGSKTYRVRVGRLSEQKEAIELERKLSEQGYSTKIFP